MWTYLGPFGNLLQIKCPIDPVEAPIERSGTEQFTLEGYRYVTRPSAAPRSWNITVDLANPDEVGPLIALEQGVYGPPPYRWYDPAAALVNMLTPGGAAPGIPGVQPWESAVPATPLVIVGPNSLDVPSAATEAQLPAVPVLPGRAYVASALFLDRPGGTAANLRMRWVDAAGATISTLSTAGVSPNRVVVTGTAPVNAAGAVLIFDPNTSTSGRFGSVQLREGTTDAAWHAGLGVGVVSLLSGLSRQYQQVYDDSRSGVLVQVQARLVEVGRA